jgi:3-dehydroquinate synthase
MVYVAELSFSRGLINAATLQLHRDLLQRYQLPVSFERAAWQKLAPLLALDKKTRGKVVRFVSLNGLGSTLRLEDLTSAELDAAYERISS